MAEGSSEILEKTEPLFSINKSVSFKTTRRY